MFFTNVAQKFIPVEPSFLNDYIKNRSSKIITKLLFKIMEQNIERWWD